MTERERDRKTEKKRQSQCENNQALTVDTPVALEGGGHAAGAGAEAVAVVEREVRRN